MCISIKRWKYRNFSYVYVRVLVNYFEVWKCKKEKTTRGVIFQNNDKRCVYKYKWYVIFFWNLFIYCSFRLISFILKFSIAFWDLWRLWLFSQYTFIKFSQFFIVICETMRNNNNENFKLDFYCFKFIYMTINQ